jgi:lipopolysaccharide biosynthesis glycosyltransferase
MRIRLFCGFDPRESIGFHNFCNSVLSRSSELVQIIPLADRGLPTGSNSFTISRFLVPYLSSFKGHAIFLDASDMLCLGDIAELDSLFDPKYAVQVVKHPDYVSQHGRKYIGTEMECQQTNYPRKNWASAMLFNCEHSAWFGMTPQGVKLSNKMDLLQLKILMDNEIGELPKEWNCLVDEDQDSEGAKILHWTAGLPSFIHYKNSRRSKDWFDALETMSKGAQYG